MTGFHAFKIANTGLACLANSSTIGGDFFRPDYCESHTRSPGMNQHVPEEGGV